MELTYDDAVGAVVRSERVSRDTLFAEFYAAHFPDVAGYCLALTSSGALADEIAQEALTRVYARWHSLREPRAYAFRIAFNLARDHWKARNRELATWAELEQHAAPPAAADPELWDAVRRLPPALCEVVLLHYLADLSVAEVARAVRRPAGTVKRRLHEARTLLAAHLEDRR